MQVIAIMLGMAIWASFSSVALAADPSLPTSCELTQDIFATFTPGKATYFAAGTCSIGTSSTIWSANTAYENQRYTETILVQEGTQPLGQILSISRWPCIDDPWLSQTKCAPETKGVNTMPGQSLSLWLQAHFYPRYNQGNPFSATFGHSREPLLAKRAADLEADARRLRHSTQPVPVITPTILSPAASALFLANTAVPIKIGAPQGLTVTGFMVKLERRDNQGNWGLVTNLPVSAAEAASPTGYLGWGTPGNGRDPSRMVSLPGTYRISAQVSLPRPTGWSIPTEFLVTTKNKAIQRAPKAFGP